ncbi:MAG: hypothetical protein ABI604_02435 [Nitrospirota bacterium]
MSGVGTPRAQSSLKLQSKQKAPVLPQYFIRLPVHGPTAQVDKARDIIASTRPVTVALHAAEVAATATK